jgi:hypothetical protein
MAGLIGMNGGMEATMRRSGMGEDAIVRYRDSLHKPEPPPPEPVAAPVELNDALPVPPAAPEAPAAPAATPAPTPAAPPGPVVPLADPNAARRGDVARLAQARARRSRSQATIIGSDTLG